MTSYGPIFDGGYVDEAVVTTLAVWMPTYLHEIEDQRGLARDSLEAPKSYTVVSEFAKWPEDQTPAVVVVNGGATNPEKVGSGFYRASWPVQVFIVCAADTEAHARRNAMIYVAAVRSSLMQRRSLQKLVDGARVSAEMSATYWGGEDYTAVPTEDRRSLFGASASFTVIRDQVFSVLGGPPTPTQAPETFGDWPTVQNVEITFIPKEDA